jgi:3-hydroxyacyl-[acyl-carrier-protein] dehydratase
MAVDENTMEHVLRLVPQQHPFRFIDRILDIGDDHITGTYRFRHDEFFYRGHFPGNPVTPGVILVEAMAQTAVVAFGIYLLMRQGITEEEISHMVTLFTTADEIEFNGIVSAGETVVVRGDRIYFRRGNLKMKVSMERTTGENVCCGVLTGRGVNVHET